MVAVMFVVLGSLAVALSLPGVFWPKAHRALFSNLIADVPQVRILAFMIVALGLANVLVGRSEVSLESNIVTGLGAVYLLCGFGIFIKPKVYLGFLERFGQAPALAWVQLCLLKSVFGIFVLSWGLHQAF